MEPGLTAAIRIYEGKTIMSPPIEAGEKNGYYWIVIPDTATLDNELEIKYTVKELTEKTACDVVLDLKQLQTVNSTVANLIVYFSRRLAKKGHTLILANVNSRCCAILQSLNITSLLPMYEGEEFGEEGRMNDEQGTRNVE